MAAVTFFTPCAAAQLNDLRLAVAPLRVEYQLQPGATLTDAAHLANEAAKPVRIEATINDWTLASDGSPVFLAPNAAAPDAFACAHWIHLNPDNFQLDGGQMERVRYTIQVPAGTPPMGCRAAILFTSAPPVFQPKEKQVLTRVRLASVIYIRVGNPAIQGQLADIRLAAAPAKPEVQPAAAHGPDWQLQLSLRNDGRTYLRANGKAELLGASGQILATFPLESQVVLPASMRVFSFPYSGPLSPGSYQLRATVDIGQPALLRIEKAIVIGAPSAANVAQLSHAR